MYKKILICGLGVLLAGSLLLFAQSAQESVAQRASEGVNAASAPALPDEMTGSGVTSELEEIQEVDDTKNPLYDNPYRVIVSRNLFSLKPPIALGNVVTNVVPLALNTNSLKFMGITTIGGVIKSHFMVAKPGQQPPQQYIALSEGQASDGLECIKINPDPVNPTAEMRADGKQIQVSFETHGVPLGGVAVAGAQQRPNLQQRGQDPRLNRTPQGGAAPQGGPQRLQAQGAQAASGGFNLPAVNAAQTASRANRGNVPSAPRGTYTGWTPFSGTSSPSTPQGGRGVTAGPAPSQRMPMTQEAAIFQNRRATTGGPPPPPMPPGR
ncbi:MAG: hypothetical protein ACOX2U_09665 [Limisphaerales bacterium]|jgi:hypothetical protein|nr:hypothetical protein [Verrucomicrobiota bacterium]